jgi:preprotein translocase subunit SecF
MSLLKGESNVNFVGQRGTFAKLSSILVASSIIAMVLLKLKFGIDFAGGYEIQVKLPGEQSEESIVEALKGEKITDVRVQTFGLSGDEYLVFVPEQASLTGEQKLGLKDKMVELAGGDADKLSAWSIAESGESFDVRFLVPVEESALREAVTSIGVEIKTISRGERTDEPFYKVTLVSIADYIEATLREKLAPPVSERIVQRIEFVGPQVGAELRNQGILAVIYSLVFILLYIAVRFDFNFAPGAIVALVHDVLITLGVFAVFQIEFNLPVIAALLAIVGYSLNDTIVVYDRIRENIPLRRGLKLHDLVNVSLNQTLSRTVLTSGTTLLVVIALLVLGGPMIRAFSIALFVGVIVGTYSSIAIASPVYIALRERAMAKDEEEKLSAKAVTA